MPRNRSFASISSPSRDPFALSAKTDKALASYTLAASAAGVALLALTPPAEAKIVYTPVQQRIGNHTFLDLNGDGINDFQFRNTVSSVCNGSFCSIRQTQAINTFAHLNVYGVAASNQALGAGRYVSQLAKGVTVGSAGPFQGAKFMGGIYGVDGSVIAQYGPWRQGGGLHQGYVGFKFMINGEVHYGWARVKTVAARTLIRALLTGYAYETTPNTPIVTGQTSGPSAALTTPELKPLPPTQVTLGMLAQGADGLAIWRREEETITK